MGKRWSTLAPVLAIQWSLWALPVHAMSAQGLMGALGDGSAHCSALRHETAPEGPAGDPQAPLPLNAPRSRTASCILHCTALAQAVAAAAPEPTAPKGLALALPGPGWSAWAPLELAVPHPGASRAGPPAADLSLLHAVFRL